jgi:hypothetical protein
VVTLVLGLAVVSATVSAGLGWLRAGGGDYDEKTLDLHRWSSIGVVVLSALALALQGAGWRAPLKRLTTVAYRVILTAAVGLLMYAGHQGGNLTHGSKYLVKNAPEFVRSWIDDEPQEAVGTTAGLDEKDRFFAEKIQPLFAHKCGECHGAEKQKGGYRLDERETALRGGKSGEVAIKPGDPLHSNLIRLITLPAHDDDIMPPEGKATLSPAEILDLVHWIGEGAHFPEPAEPTPPVAAAAVVAPVQNPPPGETNQAMPPKPASPPLVAPLPLTPTGDHLTYAHDIRPIFQRHCVVCHGPDKQKRGLRLDSREAALRGARGGETVVIPGQATQSLVYQRITIPERADPADEHMPPPHKQLPLTGDEISLIGRWINAGAP